MIPIGLFITAFAVACYFPVSLPAKGRVARGGLVGLRTPATKRSDAAWLAGHRAALPVTTGVVVVAALFGLVLAFETPKLRLSPEAGLLIGLGICVGGLLVATAIADRAARATTTPTPGTPEADLDRTERP